jgi:hypothetical protein
MKMMLHGARGTPGKESSAVNDYDEEEERIDRRPSMERAVNGKRWWW